MKKNVQDILPLDSLIILSRFHQEKRLTILDLTHSIQKSEQATRVSLEKLVEAGLVEAQRTGRGRTYTLSAKLYQKSGKKADYVRQTGFDPIQQEQMIIRLIKSIKQFNEPKLPIYVVLVLFRRSVFSRKWF